MVQLCLLHHFYEQKENVMFANDNALSRDFSSIISMRELSIRITETYALSK